MATGIGIVLKIITDGRQRVHPRAGNYLQHVANSHSCSAAKIAALDTVYSDVNDMEGLEEECLIKQRL